MDSASSIFRALYRRLPVIAFVLIGALSTGVYYASRAPTEYVAIASLIMPTEPPTMSLSNESGNLPKGPVIPDRTEDMRIGLLGVLNAGAVHERVYERLLREGRQNASREGIKKNIVGDIGRNSHIVIYAYGRTQKVAAELANMFVEEFELVLRDLAEQGPRVSLAAMTVREPQLWQEYQDRSFELVAFLDEVGSSGLDADAKALLEQRKVVTNRLYDLDERVGVARAERPVLERLIEEAGATVGGVGPFVISSRQLTRNSAYQRSLERVEQAAVALATARVTYRDEHNEVKRLKIELEHAEQGVRDAAEEEMVLQSESQTIDERARDLANRLVEAQIAGAAYEPQRAILAAREERITAELSSMPEFYARESMLRARVTQVRSKAEQMTQRRMELEFHLTRGFNFTVTDPAFMATEKSARAVPSTGGIIVFSLLAGAIFGIMLALVLEMIAEMRLRAPY